LTLEGLEVRSTVREGTSIGDDISRYSAIAVRDGPFRAAHCRFVVGPRNACLSLRDSSGEVQACQFSATDGIALHWVPRRDRTLDLRQNLLVAHGALVVDIGPLDAGPGKATLRIDRTTVRAHAALGVLRECDRRRHSLADATHPDLTIESGASVFDATHILALVDCSPLRRPRGIPPVEAIAPRIKSRVAWRGHDNLYPPAPNWLSFGSRNRKITPFPDGPADLAAWGRFWDGTETGSIVSKLSFRGPITGVNPADHALVPSGDGGDPRRLVPRGVDAEHCGPGAADADSRHLARKSRPLSN
jgi:hypothetical protein